MATSDVSQDHPFSFDFVPHSTQDTELLAQLGFLPGLKEMLMIRQVHALEHATVWVLSETSRGYLSRPGMPPYDEAQLSGMSTEQGFYLYGDISPQALQRAVHTALQRMIEGEWELAVHPRCGTNLSVAMLLTAGLAVGMHLLIPKGPIEQLVGLGVATTAAVQLAPEVGRLAQQFVTTAIPFNLAIDQIVSDRDRQGHPVHFVQVHWREWQ